MNAVTNWVQWLECYGCFVSDRPEHMFNGNERNLTVSAMSIPIPSASGFISTMTLPFPFSTLPVCLLFLHRFFARTTILCKFATISGWFENNCQKNKPWKRFLKIVANHAHYIFGFVKYSQAHAHRLNISLWMATKARNWEQRAQKHNANENIPIRIFIYLW